MTYGTVNADVIGTSVANSNLGAGNATLLKNRLIDAGFTINQRTYISGTALASGIYAHDRWKAGASGCTYTFTQLSQGVPIVITITAGSLQQVIEGCNIPDGGTFTLSWTGTAQGRVNGGTYGSSPLAVTGLTAGANCTIEFNAGTLSFPQLEVGSSATGYEYRQYQQELALCQRYYEQQNALSTGVYAGFGSGGGVATTGGQAYIKFNVTKRAAPTFNFSTLCFSDGVNSILAVTGISATYSGLDTSTVVLTVASGMTQYRPYVLVSNGSASGYISLSAEL